MDSKRIFDYARETDAILIVQGDENSVDKTFFYLTGVAGPLLSCPVLWTRMQQGHSLQRPHV